MKMVINLFDDFLKKYNIVEKMLDSTNSKIFIVERKEDKFRFICKRIQTATLKKCEYDYPNSIDSLRIVKILEIFANYVGVQKYYYLIMDYYEGSIDLFEKYKNEIVTEEQIKPIIREMALAIKDCHEQNIAHLDIKFENFVIVQENPLKLLLIDFGSSHKIDDKLIGLVGTNIYAAPEVYRGKFCLESDIWSLGVVIYYILTCDNTMERYKSQSYLMIQKSKFSEDLKVLLVGMLSINENFRYKIDDVINHKWLK